MMLTRSRGETVVVEFRCTDRRDRMKTIGHNAICVLRIGLPSFERLRLAHGNRA